MKIEHFLKEKAYTLNLNKKTLIKYFSGVSAEESAAYNFFLIFSYILFSCV